MAGTRSVQKIAVAILGAALFPFPSNSATLHVQQATPNSSIRSALSRANAGDTIVVHPGRYAEGNIQVKKKVVLRGVGLPVLDGEKKVELLSIHASGTIVEGFDLRHSGSSSMTDYAGIKAYRAHDVVVRNNILTDMFFGIYFQECLRGKALNNKITSFAEAELQSGNGIHCWKSDSMVIERNSITGHRDGIYFEFVTHSVIRNNESYGNIRYGLHFMFSHENSYLDNIFRKNGAGVAVMYTRHVTMLRNTFVDNWGSAAYGILMKDISDSRVEGNRFIGNTSGIYMEGSNRIVMRGNVFENNGCALRIQASCDGNEVEENNFSANTFDVTTNGSLMLNSFRRNYWDKYEGYDLNRDGTGDVPYHPVSLYSLIMDRMPVAVIFLRSFMVSLLDKSEKALPGITPEQFVDTSPRMKPHVL